MSAETTTPPRGLIKNCDDCPYKNVGSAVGTRGDPRSPLVLVGEAPGRGEIRDRRPFVGRAGGILMGALQDAEIDVAALFITNSVACRPDPVRPRRSAVAACYGRLADDLDFAPRTVIVALGATALASVTGRQDLQITVVRGQTFDSPWGTVVATLHPARVLRRRNECPLLVADLRYAKSLDATTVG